MKLQLKPATKRYLVIGVSVYLFEVLVILVAQALGVSGVVAVSIAFWAGLALSFLLQKVVTFEDRRFQRHIVTRQLIAYAFLVLFNFAFTVLFTKLFQDLIPAVLCRTIALGLCTIWNFYLYRTHIFRKPELV